MAVAPSLLSLDWLPNHGPLYRNLAPAHLVEISLARKEGELAANGAFAVTTGKRTGRSPKDRFIVSEGEVKANVNWNNINLPIEPTVFEKLKTRAKDYARGKELFVFDGFAGADPRYRLPVRIVTEKAWHSLFAHTLFRRPTSDELANF